MVDIEAVQPLTRQQEIALESQERFLAAYGQYGSLKDAGKISGVHPESHRRWYKEDYLGYRDRFIVAKSTFGDTLEQMAYERISEPQGNRGSDVLLMAMLNANLPEKWNRSSKLELSAPNELIQQLSALQQLAHQARPALPASDIVDGAVVEPSKPMPWDSKPDVSG